MLFVELMRRLELGGDRDGSAKLTERPREVDFSYYIRTGSYGYGERYHYNHPCDRDRAALVNAPFLHVVSSLCSVLLCFVLC
jgi:hypothetical protein